MVEIFAQKHHKNCESCQVSLFVGFSLLYAATSIQDEKLEIFTTAPIFLLSNYFRHKYLEIASCAVSLLNNIWVRVEYGQLQMEDLQ